MFQEFIEQNRARLRRLAVAALVAAFALAVYGGLGAGYWSHQIVSGKQPFGQHNLVYTYLSMAGQFLSGMFFPAVFLWGVYCLVSLARDRTFPITWILQNAQKVICAYVGVRIIMLLLWALYYRWPGWLEGASRHEIIMAALSPASNLLKGAKLVPWAILGVLWPRVVVLLQQWREGDADAGAWVEQNRQALWRLANACGIVGIAMVIYAALDGYACATRYLERAEGLYLYLNTAIRLAAHLFGAAILLGAYDLLTSACRGRRLSWLLQHGDTLIYLFSIVAILSNFEPVWRYYVEIRRNQIIPGSIWWLPLMIGNQLIVSLPLVVWALFAPVLKSGVETMERSRVSA